MLWLLQIHSSFYIQVRYDEALSNNNRATVTFLQGGDMWWCFHIKGLTSAKTVPAVSAFATKE